MAGIVPWPWPCPAHIPHPPLALPLALPSPIPHPVVAQTFFDETMAALEGKEKNAKISGTELIQACPHVCSTCIMNINELAARHALTSATQIGPLY